MHGGMHWRASIEGTGVDDLDDDRAIEDNGNCVGEGSQSLIFSSSFVTSLYAVASKFRPDI